MESLAGSPGTGRCTGESDGLPLRHRVMEPRQISWMDGGSHDGHRYIFHTEGGIIILSICIRASLSWPVPSTAHSLPIYVNIRLLSLWLRSLHWQSHFPQVLLPCIVCHRWTVQKRFFFSRISLGNSAKIGQFKNRRADGEHLLSCSLAHTELWLQTGPVISSAWMSLCHWKLVLLFYPSVLPRNHLISQIFCHCTSQVLFHLTKSLIIKSSRSCLRCRMASLKPNCYVFSSQAAALRSDTPH